MVSKDMNYGINLGIWGIHNDGTKSTETTNGINKALKWASDNGYTEIYLQEGTYLINGINENPNNPSPNGIQIPSGVSFKMHRNTVLKVEPNDSYAYDILSIANKTNVKVSGGIIIGDKDEHIYDVKLSFESGGIDSKGSLINSGNKIRTSQYLDLRGYPNLFKRLRYWVNKNDSVIPTKFDAYYYDESDKLVGTHLGKTFSTAITSDVPSKTVKVKITVTQSNPDGCEVSFINGLWMANDFGYGTAIRNSHNVTVENMHIYNCTGDAVYFGNSSTNVLISNCELHDCRRQGVSVVGAINSIIDRCEIYNISGAPPQYGVDIEALGNKNITVSNCYIYDNKGGGVKLYTGDYHVCENNFLVNNGISLNNTDFAKVLNNTVKNADIFTDAYHAIFTRNALIDGNIVEDGNISVASGASNTTVSNNKIIRGTLRFSGTTHFMSIGNTINTDSASLERGFDVYPTSVTGVSIGDTIIGAFTSESARINGNGVKITNMRILKYVRAMNIQSTSSNPTIIENIFMDREDELNTTTEDLFGSGFVVIEGGVIKNQLKPIKFITSSSTIKLLNIKFFPKTTTENIILNDNPSFEISDCRLYLPTSYSGDALRIQNGTGLISNNYIENKGYAGIRGIFNYNGKDIRIWENKLINCIIKEKTGDDLYNNKVI